MSSYKSGLNPHFTNKPQLVKTITSGPLTESLVDSSAKEKEMVLNMIQETMPKIKFKKIMTVKNSFLASMYLLKKEEYKSRNGKLPQEMLLFHVTSASNVNSIISNNFDWRRIKRGKFGLGTSFSGDAEYANQYANFDIGDERAVIVTAVLICKVTAGQDQMVIPHGKFDTSVGNDGKVYVKFCDNEILPKYVVFFNSNTITQSKNKKCVDNKPVKADSWRRTSQGLYNKYDYFNGYHGDVYRSEEYYEDEYYDEEEEYDDEEYEDYDDEEEYEDCDDEEEYEDYDDEEEYEDYDDDEEYEDYDGEEEYEDYDDEEFEGYEEGDGDCEEEGLDDEYYGDCAEEYEHAYYEGYDEDYEEVGEEEYNYYSYYDYDYYYGEYCNECYCDESNAYYGSCYNCNYRSYSPYY